MKKVFLLILKCAAALLPLWLIIIYIAAKPLAYLSSDSVGAYWNRCFTNESHEKYNDVVILGDSMAATSFMPELLSDTTINLALSGSSPVEGYYTLKHYLDNNPAPTDIFVCYMDYHLAHDDFTLDTCNQVHKFSLADYIEIYKTIKETGANGFEDVQMSDYWQKAIASSFYMPSEYIASIINSIKEGGRLDANTASYNEIDMLSGRACRMTNDISTSSGLKYDDFSVSPLQGAYYKRIVDLCESNDISLHVIKLPLDGDTLFTDEYIAKVSGYYMVLLEEASLAEFKWYPADYPVELFWDDYHMNQHGSYRFSMQLKQDYKEIWGGDKVSAAQMRALNNDIAIENLLPEIFKWTNKKDYTIVMYDDMNNNLEDSLFGIYNSLLKVDDNQLTRYGDTNYYFLNGVNTKSDANIDVEIDNDTITVNGTDYLFDINKNMLSIIVIDNVNGVVATNRGFEWNAADYSFVKSE